MTWKSESALKRKEKENSTPCGYWTETNKPEKKRSGEGNQKAKTKPSPS